MSLAIVHIAFGPSGAENLENALKQAGRADRVARHLDNLAVGPIDPPDPQARAAWMVQVPGQDILPGSEAFWYEALRPDARKVAWMSRRSAPEYCAFLEWLSRLGEPPCEVIDLTDMPVGNRRRAFLLSLLDAEEIANNLLWDRAEPLQAAARARYHSLWRQLRAENAPLRVVAADGLLSAPMSFFDERLFSFATPSWQKPARLVGRVMAEWVGPELEPYFQAGDDFLAARIPVLVEQGRLEGRGDLLDIRASEVRLPGGE